MDHIIFITHSIIHSMLKECGCGFNSGHPPNSQSGQYLKIWMWNIWSAISFKRVFFVSRNKTRHKPVLRMYRTITNLVRMLFCKIFVGLIRINRPDSAWFKLLMLLQDPHDWNANEKDSLIWFDLQSSPRDNRYSNLKRLLNVLPEVRQ